MGCGMYREGRVSHGEGYRTAEGRHCDEGEDAGVARRWWRALSQDRANRREELDLPISARREIARHGPRPAAYRVAGRRAREGTRLPKAAAAKGRSDRDAQGGTGRGQACRRV